MGPALFLSPTRVTWRHCVLDWPKAATHPRSSQRPVTPPHRTASTASPDTVDPVLKRSVPPIDRELLIPADRGGPLPYTFA